jgi:hypothetical protein
LKPKIDFINLVTLSGHHPCGGLGCLFLFHSNHGRLGQRQLRLLNGRREAGQMENGGASRAAHLIILG